MPMDMRAPMSVPEQDDAEERGGSLPEAESPEGHYTAVCIVPQESGFAVYALPVSELPDDAIHVPDLRTALRSVESKLDLTSDAMRQGFSEEDE